MSILIFASHYWLNIVSFSITLFSFQAIQQLSRSGFLHYAAIANERAGVYMRNKKDDYWATHYLTTASSLYAEWGATAKAHDMVKLYCLEESSLAQTIHSSGVFLQGKAQYKANRDAIQDPSRLSGSSYATKMQSSREFSSK